MATIKDKIAGATVATPKEIMETNFDNINMSYDQHIEYYRKKKEIKAKLEIEKAKLEAELEAETKELEKTGKEDIEQKASNEEV